MVKILFIFSLFFSTAHAASLSDSVNLFIGTGPSNVENGVPGGTGGGTQPAAVVPFGMVQFGPDTTEPEQSGYDDLNNAIRDFSVTHLSGPGCENTGELPMLPFSDTAVWPVNGIPFDHAKQIAKPGYYKIVLPNNTVELTATERAGMARIQYPATAKTVGIMLNTSLNGRGPTTGDFKYINNRTFRGFVMGGGFCGSKTTYSMSYTLEFNRDTVTKTFTNGLAVMTFPNDGQPLLMKVGISYVSRENSTLNMTTELPAWDFDAVVTAARTSWDRALDTIKITTTSNENAKTIFYTALYHSLLHPNLGSDVNGDYMGFDFKPHNDSTRPHYINFSGWDVYRSQVQLLAALFPKRASDIAQSLVDAGLHCGSIPHWSQNNGEANVMVGDPGAISIANFHAFGATEFDLASAFTLLKKAATDPTAQCQRALARVGLTTYINQGYLPLPSPAVWGPTATTLEYNSADFAVSRFAKAVGQDQFSSEMLARSSSWRYLWDPSVKAIRPRIPGGEWYAPFALESMDGFVEGNSAQYTWMIPFDLEGLVGAMGGDAATVTRLDTFLEKRNAGLHQPNLYIGNEPGFGTPWVYLWAHAPARAQQAIRNLMATEFRNEPGGLPGNDDLGATSSWYVWSALGMFPEIPGEGGVAIGSPAFSDILITPENQPSIRIVAHGAEDSVYVEGVRVDGKSLNRTWMSWDKVKAAKEIRFEMNANPQGWGTLAGSEPPSQQELAVD